VRAEAYVQVRGFPKRSGGEDFYLLNKLAKIGAIAQPGGKCILLQSRNSQRVPFGTGPAVVKITAAANADEVPLFYHPDCFETLRCLLAVVPALHEESIQSLASLLAREGLAEPLHQPCQALLHSMGLEAALRHCRQHGKTRAQFLRQFHQWFDGFRTLKFIHGLRDTGWEEQPLAALRSLQPQLWPATTGTLEEVESLRLAVRQHWGWGRD
jgi:hypothetical protein